MTETDPAVTDLSDGSRSRMDRRPFHGYAGTGAYGRARRARGGAARADHRHRSSQPARARERRPLRRRARRHRPDARRQPVLRLSTARPRRVDDCRKRGGSSHGRRCRRGSRARPHAARDGHTVRDNRSSAARADRRTGSGRASGGLTRVRHQDFISPLPRCCRTARCLADSRVDACRIPRNHLGDRRDGRRSPQNPQLSTSSSAWPPVAPRLSRSSRSASTSRRRSKWSSGA